MIGKIVKIQDTDNLVEYTIESKYGTKSYFELPHRVDATLIVGDFVECTMYENLYMFEIDSMIRRPNPRATIGALSQRIIPSNN